jgi:hypothetical protein
MSCRTEAVRLSGRSDKEARVRIYPPVQRTKASTSIVRVYVYVCVRVEGGEAKVQAPANLDPGRRNPSGASARPATPTQPLALPLPPPAGHPHPPRRQRHFRTACSAYMRAAKFVSILPLRFSPLDESRGALGSE